MIYQILFPLKSRLFLSPRLFLSVASLIACAFLLAACSRQNEPQLSNAQPSPAPPTIAKAHDSFGDAGTSDEDLPAPPTAETLGWTLLDNRRVALAEMRGQVVVLDFYATWCLPCREEVPHLVELERLYKKQGLRVVGLNVGGDDDIAEIPAFVEEFKIGYQLGSPDLPLVFSLMGDESAIPQTFVFNRQGKLIKHFVGFDEDTKNELTQIVQQALAEKS